MPENHGFVDKMIVDVVHDFDKSLKFPNENETGYGQTYIFDTLTITVALYN